MAPKTPGAAASPDTAAPSPTNQGDDTPGRTVHGAGNKVTTTASLAEELARSDALLAEFGDEPDPIKVEEQEPAKVEEPKPALSEWHRQDLHASGVTDAVIDSVGGPDGPRQPIEDDRSGKGWSFPVSDGQPIEHVHGEYGMRVLIPDRDKRRKNAQGKEVKVEWPAGQTTILASVRYVAGATDHVLAEGPRQSLAIASHVSPDTSVWWMNGIRGVHDDNKHRLGFLKGCRVTIVPDADWHTNGQVAHAALETVPAILEEIGAAAVLVADVGGIGKDGIDDILGDTLPERRAEKLAKILDDAKPARDRRLELETDKELVRLQARDEAKRRHQAELSGGAVDPGRSRWVDLSPYLDGTHTPPEPGVGAERADGVRLLYPAKWHTVIGLTGCGKTWFACWHVAHELKIGHTVVYLHFEEAGPGPTLERIRLLGVPDDVIRGRLRWAETDDPWSKERFTAHLAELDPAPTLVVLDGINEACTIHAWPVNDPDGVGAYRQTFVKPATRLDTAVLSLGHPVKDRMRQTERHGFGGTGWLDVADGVGFRLEATRQPVHRGSRGAVRLYSVKDRAGSVERHGVHNEAREVGWWYMGMFILDDTKNLATVNVQDGYKVEKEHFTTAELIAPAVEQDQVQPGDRDKIDDLADAVVEILEKTGGRYQTKTRLGDRLRAAKVRFSSDDLGSALERLQEQARLERGPEPISGRAWPGWLPGTAPETDPEPKPKPKPKNRSGGRRKAGSKTPGKRTDPRSVS